MKKLLLLISLSIGCFTASAQPTSFGGITPGQTTREDLKSLVKDPSKVEAKDNYFYIELKHPDGNPIWINLHNDIVYEIDLNLDSWTELKQALIEKYGLPSIKVGSIRTVTCRNKLGASFERLDGEEEMQWPVKDGVQGALRRWAGNCAEYTYQEYKLRHVATVKAVKSAKLENERKEAEEKRRNLGNAY